jgi:hypothetical protein
MRYERGIQTEPHPFLSHHPNEKEENTHSITLLITLCELAEKLEQQHILCLVTLLNEATRTGKILDVYHLAALAALYKLLWLAQDERGRENPAESTMKC